MLHEQAISQSSHERTHRTYHGQKCCEHDGVFHRGLPALIRCQLP